MSDLLNAAALDQLFRTARTQNAFLDTPVSEDLLRELYDLVKWGPTAANGSPARFVFVTTAEGKESSSRHCPKATPPRPWPHR